MERQAGKGSLTRQAERLRGEHADRQVDLEEGTRTGRLTKRQAAKRKECRQKGKQA